MIIIQLKNLEHVQLSALLVCIHLSDYLKSVEHLQGPEVKDTMRSQSKDAPNCVMKTTLNLVINFCHPNLSEQYTPSFMDLERINL